MDKHFLADYPPPEEIRKKITGSGIPDFREVNGHIHTPFSFSSFSDMEEIFRMAREESIAVLGINDFFVTHGFEPFYRESLKNRIFPLFNIEFTGLMKSEREKGIRINDPNNPGRIYFSGKGLDYPFNPGFLNRIKLNSVIKESQSQIKAMIAKLNSLIREVNPSLKLSYDEIRSNLAMEMVRERHLAKAVRILAEKSYSNPDARIEFLSKLYGGNKPATGNGNPSLLENEIRSKLLKSGGRAFVEENEAAFLDTGRIIRIILSSGGIPCYPVLLDDASGRFTEFESDPGKLYKSLTDLKVGCIELIPGRNDISVLRKFVKFFHEKNFVILFGTEHNTPGLFPLTVKARGGEALGNDLKSIAWEGACVTAAHQYLRAKGMQGYILASGMPSFEQKKELTYLGRLIIEFFLSNN